MYDRREPILMCATGKKGVGKTYTTMNMIKSYLKPNKKIHFYEAIGECHHNPLGIT